LLHSDNKKQEWCHMQCTRWASVCALAGGVGVVFIEPSLGSEGFAAFTGVDPDLRILAGAVALVGALIMLFGDMESKELWRGKGSSS
jgi:hypothetical protein